MPGTPEVTTATDALLSGLAAGAFEYALIGGLAVVLQGHDRFTQDVDALVWDLDSRLEALVDLLEDRGFSTVTEKQLAMAKADRILHLRFENGTAVDIFLGFLPFERETVNRAQSMTLFNGLTAKVSTPEDLIIMKLIAGRPRDLEDVGRLFELYPEVDCLRVRRIVRDYGEALENPKILESLDALFPAS